MFIAWRYLVTVRRATVTPAAARSLTNWSSLLGCVVLVVDKLLEFQTDRVPGHFLAVGADGAAAEESLQGKMPRGVWIHLSSTARLTVVTCTPTLSAICCIFSGSIDSGPLLRNSVW